MDTKNTFLDSWWDTQAHRIPLNLRKQTERSKISKKKFTEMKEGKNEFSSSVLTRKGPAPHYKHQNPVCPARSRRLWAQLHGHSEHRDAATERRGDSAAGRDSAGPSRAVGRAALTNPFPSPSWSEEK